MISKYICRASCPWYIIYPDLCWKENVLWTKLESQRKSSWWLSHLCKQHAHQLCNTPIGPIETTPCLKAWWRRSEFKTPRRSHLFHTFEHFSHPERKFAAFVSDQCTSDGRSKLNKLYVSVCYQLTFFWGPKFLKNPQGPPPGSTGKEIFRQESPKNSQQIGKNTTLVVAQPSPCCSFARHLVGKMVIHCSFAHH